MKRFLIALYISLAAAGSVTAQEWVGTIEGSVRDLQGKPIEGATVYAYDTAHMSGRFERHTTVSHRSGAFSLPNLPAGEYRIHAYKPSEGYADTFFLFFTTENKKAWKTVRVSGGRTAVANLSVGPKYAKLKISIRNQFGVPLGGGLSFRKMGAPSASYSIGVNADSELLVPPQAFEVEVITTDYEPWKSQVLNPRPEETINLTVRLKPSRKVR
jgi:Carboxypeptidase regulatory-like domain